VSRRRYPEEKEVLLAERLALADHSAILSKNRKYRYVLYRTWDEGLIPLTYIMLNPSTADESVDDATIRVCMGRAKRLGFGGILVLNLFAYRATDPQELYKVRDPVGPDNDLHLRTVCEHDTEFVLAWSNHGSYLNRDKSVLDILREHKVRPWCLGLTQQGNPLHPLHQSYDTKLRRYKFG
jgi:hypothetical protein